MPQAILCLGALVVNFFTASEWLRNTEIAKRISPQFYGQPLISAGDYHDFKELARPKSYLFNHYGQGGSTFSETTLVADPDGPGPAEPIQLPNPNFNFKSLRANAVWRWEYRPGSTFYAVPTQHRPSRARQQADSRSSNHHQSKV